MSHEERLAVLRPEPPRRRSGRELARESSTEHLKVLFKLHDLNGDGFLSEAELVQLNEQIAYLHHGPDFDASTVRATYSALFRSTLAPNGELVSCEVFCDYTRQVLDGLDRDPAAQEMILEQWVAEAQACRQLFGACGSSPRAAQTQRASRGGSLDHGAADNATWLPRITDGCVADGCAGNQSETDDTCSGAADTVTQMSESELALDAPLEYDPTHQLLPDAVWTTDALERSHREQEFTLGFL